MLPHADQLRVHRPPCAEFRAPHAGSDWRHVRRLAGEVLQVERVALLKVDVEGAELAKATLAVGAAHHPLLLFGAAAVLGILSIVVITMLLLNVSSRCWGSSCAGCQQWYCVSTNTND